MSASIRLQSLAPAVSVQSVCLFSANRDEYEMKLSQNTVVITGGTAGIGLGFARRFSAAGSRVIICGRRKNRLEEINRSDPRIETLPCDISRAEEREAFARLIVERYPETNVLINNAGVQLLTDLTRPVDLERVRLEVETNLIAPIHLGSLFVPHLRTKPNGALVNISSGLAMVPLAFMPVYCATKAALHSLTLSLRHQLRDTPIKVFEVAPPAVDTELGHDRRADKTQSHGGMPIEAFLDGAMAALSEDRLEAPIGGTKTFWENKQTQFEAMNANVRG